MRECTYSLCYHSSNGQKSDSCLKRICRILAFSQIKNEAEKISPTMNVAALKYELDRFLLFPFDRVTGSANNEYSVVCEPDEKIKIGDTVEYETMGANFGWFLRKVEP